MPAHLRTAILPRDAPRTVNPPLPDRPLIHLPLDGGHFTDALGTRITNRYGSHAVFSRNSSRVLSNGSEVTTGRPGWDGGLWVEEGTTNLLTANQASVETDTTGLFAWNTAVLSRTTAEKWHGVASLQVQTAGLNTNEGFGVSAVSANPNAAYTGSAYIKAPAGIPMRFFIQAFDATNQWLGTVATVFTGTGSWQRVAAVYESTPANTAKVNVGCYTYDTVPRAITFYVDGLQIENKSYATSWHPGGSTRASEVLTADLRPALGSWPPQVTLLGAWTPVVIRASGHYAGMAQLGTNTTNYERFQFVFPNKYIYSMDGSGSIVDWTLPQSLSAGVKVAWACWRDYAGQARVAVKIGANAVAFSAPAQVPRRISVPAYLRIAHLHWTPSHADGRIHAFTVLPRLPIGTAEVTMWLDKLAAGLPLPW